MTCYCHYIVSSLDSCKSVSRPQVPDCPDCCDMDKCSDRSELRPSAVQTPETHSLICDGLCLYLEKMASIKLD